MDSNYLILQIYSRLREARLFDCKSRKKPYMSPAHRYHKIG